MVTTKHPRQELDLAAKALNSMEHSSNVTEFEENWVAFLHRLERIWSKSEAFYSAKNEKVWKGWKSDVQKKRRVDPLLSYLTKARGAEEHSVREISTRESSRVSLSAKDAPVKIRGFSVTSDGKFFADAEGPLALVFYPERMMLLPVPFRGRTYDVPRTHLGNEIDPDDVLGISHLALQFYAGVLDESEKKFGA